MCQKYQQRYPTSVQLYERAFKAEPALADPVKHSHRPHAIHAASLGGAGLGDKPGKMSAEQRAKLRRQARDWLQTDFTLQHDPDLGSIRDSIPLAQLSAEERQDWQRLWMEVHEAITSRVSEMRVEGKLTMKQKSRVP